MVETEYPDELLVACCRIRVDAVEGVSAIDVMAVEPRFQGKGAGSYLLRKAENMAMGMGCVKVRSGSVRAFGSAVP